jgi:hypothetical protein
MSEIQELCKKFIAAKAEETRANALRVSIEAEIIKIVGNRTEGAQTSEHDGFKITTTGKITRKMDWDKWAQVKAQIPTLLHPIKVKEELDEKGVKYLADNEPAIYALLPIEIKPAKTAVEVKQLEVAKQ